MYTSPKYTFSTDTQNVQIADQTIRGTICLPDASGSFPLVITAHGLGGTYRDGLGYADALCPYGFAVYTFDFRGGSPGSLSDGSTTEMSVLTEAADLEAVVSAARSWPAVDPARIVLLGSSQGGMASAICAGRIPNEICGLILCYPAFVIPDDVHREFRSLSDLPETYSVLGFFPAGRVYGADVWGYEAYSEIGGFTKPVLILHGSDDPVVPVRYSKGAAAVYENAHLHIVEGAGHGFVGAQFDEALQYILAYLRQQTGF